MNRRFDQDIELYQKKQMACKKLTYLEELSKQLKNVPSQSLSSISAKSLWNQMASKCLKNG
jgi:hypothetical protein